MSPRRVSSEIITITERIDEREHRGDVCEIGAIKMYRGSAVCRVFANVIYGLCTMYTYINIACILVCMYIDVFFISYLCARCGWALCLFG